MRPPAGSLAVAGVSTLLGLLAVELALSRWRPLEPSRFAPDARLLFRLAPGFRARPSFPASHGAREVSFEVNRLGFVGPEPPGNGRAARVVVYGDSFVEGYSTPAADRFVARLAPHLRRRWGRDVEMVNAGVGGYGPDQVSLRLEDELAALRPAAIVVALFAGNDFGDLLRNKIFGLSNGRLMRRPYRLDPELESGLAPRGVRRLALWRALRLARREWGARWVPEGPAGGSLAWALAECERDWRDYASGSPIVTNPFVDHYDADVGLRPGLEPARVKRALMGGVLSRLRDQAALRGVPLLAVLIPAPEDLRSGRLAGELRSLPGYRPEALTDALEGAAQAAGVGHVNLFEAFRRRGGDALYYERDLHWNAEAQELAARLAAEALGPARADRE